MLVYTADSLKKCMACIAARGYRKRFCYDKFRDLVVNTNDRKVVALYGLRRTGKSTLMAQLIMDIGQYNNTCLIQCSSGDYTDDLRKAIKGHQNCRYIFVDEAAKLEDFSKDASFLSDIYSARHRIVLSGTDSLAFRIAQIEELYEKIHMIHTTYIPYKEYNYLLGRSLDDYIQYGGTLTPENTFYNVEMTEEYSNSAIAENIQHSLDNLGIDGEYGSLSVFRTNDELTTFLNKIIEIYNRKFTHKIVNNNFKTHDILTLFEHNKNKTTADYYQLDTKTNIYLRDEIRYSLNILENLSEYATKNTINEAKSYLEDLDVIYKIPGTDEVIFTQPGLKYSQCTAQVDVILNSCNINFSESQRKELSAQLANDIKGRMLEDIIYYQMAKDEEISREFRVSKFQRPNAGEFDLALIAKNTNEAYIIEVKHSGKVVDKQARHLTNTALCKSFEEETGSSIVGRMVVYMGPTLKEKQHGVNYVSAEDFLTDTRRVLEKVRTVEEIRATIPAVFRKCTPEAVFTDAYNRAFAEYSSHEVAAVTAARKLYRQGFDRTTVITTVDGLAPLSATDEGFTSRVIRMTERSPEIQHIIREQQMEQEYDEDNDTSPRPFLD